MRREKDEKNNLHSGHVAGNARAVCRWRLSHADMTKIIYPPARSLPLLRAAREQNKSRVVVLRLPARHLIKLDLIKLINRRQSDEARERERFAADDSIATQSFRLTRVRQNKTAASQRAQPSPESGKVGMHAICCRHMCVLHNSVRNHPLDLHYVRSFFCLSNWTAAKQLARFSRHSELFRRTHWTRSSFEIHGNI